MNKKKNRGFSLVELIVVVAIMAVLVGVLAPSLLRYVEKTRIQKDATAVSEVVEAARIALADETLYTNCNVATTKTISIDAAGDITSAVTGLADEIKKTVPKVPFTGKDKEAVTITITMTNGSPSFACTCTGTSDWVTAITAVK